MSQIQFSHINTDDAQYITVFIPGRGLQPPVGSDHPNFKTIAAACAASMRGEDVAVDELVDLFDVGATVARKFQQLTERVAVKDGQILLDGDPVHGTLQDQILDFVDAGEDFGPLVNFYEKLLTNPLGNVQQGVYDWIVGQRANGALTITPDGDLIGYKSMQSATPEWRTDEDVVYVPSRRGEGIVNGRDVTDSEYIEQVPGDVVEMPRSRVLNAPSRECGDGLHIGTYQYASTFSGDTVMLVQFNPRDIVSLPDNHASWKLRVCRYTVLGAVDEPLDVPLYITESNAAEAQQAGEAAGIDLALDGCGTATFQPGDRVVDGSGDFATVQRTNEDGSVDILWDDSRFGSNGQQDISAESVADGFIRKAEGTGVRDASGRWVKGRPGSKRDSSGRFCG